jgi:acetyl esterase/lipase
MVVALHFHGGAFVIGNGRDEDTGLLARSLTRHTGCNYVCTPQYRLSSSKNGHFPAPLQDALTTYLFLIKTKGIPAEQIILSGDSAGANLALALLRYIHEYGKEDEVPLPRAVMLWSPWVDVSAAAEQDMALSPNYRTDYLNKQFGQWGALTISAYGKIDPKGPYLSPLHHPFRLEKSLPVFVHAGGSEVLCDDIREFCKRYKEHGWQIHLDVTEGCPHDILLLGSRIGFGAEADKAAGHAREFLSEAAGLTLRSFYS